MVIIGIDPGIHSFATAVLKDGQLVACEQAQRRRGSAARKTGLDSERLNRIVDSEYPVAAGLEGVEFQPWKTNGKVPSQGVRLVKIVDAMQEELCLRGIHVYRQSPSIQSCYPDFAVDQLIRNAMGQEFKISAHLRSAVKHALQADSMYRRMQQRRRSR